jgi:hypothetical protein
MYLKKNKYKTTWRTKEPKVNAIYIGWLYMTWLVHSVRRLVDTKRVIRIRISKNRQHNYQKKKYKKDKQRSTKHYTEN